MCPDLFEERCCEVMGMGGIAAMLGALGAMAAIYVLMLMLPKLAAFVDRLFKNAPDYGQQPADSPDSTNTSDESKENSDG